MVNPVTRVSATSGSAATQVDSSVVSRAEPDNVWAAHRQAQINADLAAMKTFREQQEESRDEDEPAGSLDDRHLHKRHETEAPEAVDESSQDSKLSGESERIGTRNFDDETPFGHRVLII